VEGTRGRLNLDQFDGALASAGDSVDEPSGPGNGGNVFRYRLHSPDGDDLGEATYAIRIKVDEEIHLNGGERFRILEGDPR